MSHRMNFLILVMSIAGISGLDAQVNTKQAQAEKNAKRLNQIENEEYEILKRDQIDNTDIYEIPFGDSEVEDEEEINRAEKKDTFKLPNPR